MRISDWSSDVCSTDLLPCPRPELPAQRSLDPLRACQSAARRDQFHCRQFFEREAQRYHFRCPFAYRSEEHTSELQSLMRISYAVFCLKKKKKTNTVQPDIQK